MLNKAIEKLTSTSIHKAMAQGQLTCPDCGTPADTLPDAGANVMKCDACGAVASLTEWAPTSKNRPLRGFADQPPADTKIHRTENATGISWQIPATRKSNFFLFFGVMWLLISGLVTSGFVFAFFNTTADNKPPLFIFLPLAGFCTIGVGFIYFGLRTALGSSEIFINSQSVALRRNLFGRKSDKTLPREEVTSVEQVQFYQQNYNPVFGIEIRTGKKKIRFGSQLTPEEKAWLVADFKQVLFGNPTTAGANLSQTGHYQTKPSYFSIVIPNNGNMTLVSAIMLLTISGAFIFLGLAMLMPQQFTATFPFLKKLSLGAPDFFGWMWTLISSVVFLVGLLTAGKYFRGRTDETKLEGTEHEISLRTYRHGLVIKDRTFPRSEVLAIRDSVSGNMNGKPTKRIELIVGNQVEVISRWTLAEKADPFLAEARQFIG